MRIGKRSRMNVTWLFLSVWVAGCQSTNPRSEREIDETKTVLPVAKERSTVGDGGLLMVTEFQNAEAAGLKDANCRWRLINRETKKSYFAEISLARGPASFTSLPPGNYLTGRLACGLSRVWDLDKIFTNGMTIEGERVSYIGKLNFIFQGRELKEVRKASRSESAGSLTSALAVVPASSGPLASGFTQRPISPTMYRGGLSEGFDIQSAGLANPTRVLDPVARNLKTCANSETPSDPLRIGHLEYVALYKQGRFTEMKSRTDENAFSDRMRACVEQSLMKFQSADKGQFEIRVRY